MTAALIPEAASVAGRGAAAGGASTAAKNSKSGSVSVRQAKKTVSGQAREASTSRSRSEGDTYSHVSETVRTRKRGRSAGTRRSSPGTSGAKRMSTGTLIAEWVLGVVLIVITVPMEKSEHGYVSTVSTMMLRLTGLTGIFFVLALLSESEHARKFAIWFGVIIDLGIIYHATTSGSTKKVANILNGKGSGGGGIVLASDYTDKDTPPQPTPFGENAPTFSSDNSSNSSPGSSPGGRFSNPGGAELNPNYPGGSTTIPTPPVGGSA